MRRSIGLIVLLLALRAVAGQCQTLHNRFPAINPAFPLLSSTFGNPASVDTPDATGIGASLNPASNTFVLDFGQKTAAEIDFGQQVYRHSGPHIAWTLVDVDIPLGRRSAIRIGLNTMHSSLGEFPITAPGAVGMSGTALEIAYAYRLLRDLDVGLTLTPVDEEATHLYLLGESIAAGNLRSRLQGRVGILYHHGQVRGGYEVGLTEGILSSTIPTMSTRAHWTQHDEVVGVAWAPSKGTSLFYNRQTIRLDTTPNFGIGETAINDYWGIKQFLTPNLQVGWARSGTGTGFTIGYYRKEGGISLSYGEQAYSASKRLYGVGDALFVTISLNL